MTFHVFIIRFHKLIDNVTSSTFLPLIKYPYQLKDLILLWYFLGVPAMLILVQKESEQDQTHIFQHIL